MRRLMSAVSVAALLGLTAACSAGSGPAATLAPALSSTQISQADATTRAFGERYFGAWPVADEISAQLADDAVFSDPTDGDLLTGKGLTQMLSTMQSAFPDLAYQVNHVFLSTDGALYELEVDGIWPPWVPEPASHPVGHEMQAVRLEGDLLGATELAFPVSELEMFPLGCFRDHGCSDQYDQLVTDYVSAWTSGDAKQIAALYRDDAVFTDSLLGLKAEGARQIGSLGQERFGPATDVSIEVLGTYAQTNRYLVSTSAQPFLGAIIGAGVHYRATMSMNGQEVSLESFTLLRYATFSPGGLDTDPDGRIVEERVFHDAASLTSWLQAAGLAT